LRRAILSSVLIIGAALAVVFAGGSFSAFTDEEQINGEANAAIVDFELTSATVASNTTGTTETTPSADDILTINFDSTSTECAGETELAGQDYFAPGDSCTIEVNLTRANIEKQLAVILSVNNFTVGAVGDTNSGSDGDVADDSIGIDCDGVAGADWHISWAFADDTGDANYMPAATADDGQQIRITVSLDEDAAGDAGAGCQGDELDTISLTIHAEQDTANSHNTTDNQ
jgi:predicted ribosomally synthesized peptide with SipW-like signal peptide